MRRTAFISGGWLGLVLALAAATVASEPAQPASDGQDADEVRLYTYSWPFSDEHAMRPRGGTTDGPDVTLAEDPSDGWRRLTEPGQSDFERDRRAILAMAGSYRTTFDFIETIGFGPDYQPRRPYQSWATEQIRVIADAPRFISLQHILVMTFVQPDGTVSEPVVVKHWRQDWRYQDSDVHVYAGNGRWQRRQLDPDDVRGAWSQAVYQVDDSPRYQALGRWQHHREHSTWTSEPAWRPLPRRESSVRDDYDTLIGTNRVTITRQGWIHEEDNLKAVLDAAGRLDPETPYLAREAGLNRYRHIVDYDFSAGDAYWHRTGEFWRQVREAWQDLFAEHDSFVLRPAVDGAPLFQVMFELAERFDSPETFDAAAARAEIDAALAEFVRT